MSRLSVVLLALAMGCPRPPSGEDGEAEEPARDAPREGGATIPAHPAGATCGGRRDCAADQVCVGSVCRYRRSSIRGEVLATAAREQWEAGDARSALETYEQARTAFDQGAAPVPPEVLCGAALAALEFHDSPQDQERGATTADLCFRGSLPSDPGRRAVLEGVAALRYDGLILSAFDADRPPDRFYGDETSRPTTDAVDVELSIPDANEQGLAAIRATLEGDPARRAIADCFVREWEQNHQRRARAALLLEFTTRLRDMGEYEIYVGQVRVAKTNTADEGFEACATRALSSLLEEGPRLRRAAIWQLPFEVHAGLR